MQRNLLPRKSPEEFGLLGGNQVMFRTFCLLGLLVAASGCAAVTAPVATAPPPSVMQTAPPQQAVPPQPAAASQPALAPVSQSVAARQAAIKPQAANVTAPVAAASRQAPQQATNAVPPEAVATPPAAQAEIPPPAQTVAPVGAAAPIAPAAKEAETPPAPAPASALPAETAKPGLSPAALALVDYWYIGLGLIVLLLILLSLLARRRDPPAEETAEPVVLQTGEPAPGEAIEPTQEAEIDPPPSEATEAAQPAAIDLPPSEATEAMQHAETDPPPGETTEPASHAEAEPPQQPVVLPPPASPANGGNGVHGKNGTNGAHGIEPLFANTSVAIGRDNEFCAVRFINPARVPTTFEGDCLVVAVEHALPSTPHYPAEAVERLEHPVSVEAGQPFSIKRPNRVSAQDWERIQRGEAALWLYGYFDYRDAHQTLRRQGFCYAYLPSPSAASFPPGNGRVTTMMGPRAYNYVTALGRDAYPKEALDLAGVELREHQAD